MIILKKAKGLCLLLILLFSAPSIAIPHSRDSFSISPYLLKKTHDQVHLKFQISDQTTEELSFINSLDGQEIKTNRNQLTTLSLEKQTCSKAQTMSLLNDKKIPVFTLNIPPFPCDPEKDVHFIFISDTQKHPQRHHKMAELLSKRIKKRPMSFIINGGDIVQDGSVESKWKNFLKASTPYSQKIPIVPVLGNHDYWGHDDNLSNAPLFFKKYLMTKNDNKDGYYALNYPQFKLIVLNSNFTRLGLNTINLQKEWLRKELEKSKNIDQNVIITFHHSPITSNLFYYGPVSIAMRNSWIPLFEKSGVVKLILNGHSHLYERSLKNGIMYVVAGPFGGQINFLPKMSNFYRLAMFPNTETFSLFKVSKRYITMETYDKNDKMIDQFEIENNL
jgi:predicted phosphodiesterase